MAALCGQAQTPPPADIFRFDAAGLNDHLTNRFALRNPGAEAMAVYSVTPSCECVHVMLWPTNVAGGGTGTVEILFVPDKAGAVDYRVRVKTSSPEAPEIEYAIQGMVTSAPRARVDRDWSLYLDSAAAKAAIKDPGSVLLVDVRGEGQFESIRIPGAIQVPLYAVKTKAFLRSRPVVLVDEGHGSHRLDEECRKLRELGFGTLSVWYGGLNAWRRRGGVLEGSGPVDRVPPIALHDISYSTDWLVVTAGGSATNGLEGVVALSFDPAKPEDFASALNAAIKDRPQVGSVLLATDKGEDYSALAALAGRIDAFVFFLDGGWESWEAHRRMMGAIQQGRTMSTQSTSSGGVKVRPGCGGCPK